MGNKEIDKTKKIFKEAWDSLNDIFDEKRSDTVVEKIKKAQREEVALCKFSKGMIGNTNQINFRILVGGKTEPGDIIYEAVYMNDKKEPYIYVFDVDSERNIKNVLKNFHDDGWGGYKKVYKYKSLTKFLESVYKNDIYYKGKKYKKEEALNILIKKGLKRTLEAVAEDVKEKQGDDHPLALKILKVVAITAITTIAMAALTPAAGVVLSNIQAGGGIGGSVLGDAANAAAEGIKSVVDPTKIVKKIVSKTATKGMPLGRD